MIAYVRVKGNLLLQVRFALAGALMKSPKSLIRTVVVDDSPAALRTICSVVARQPNMTFVGAATNGREALALARTLRPDLVLLDLEMPVMGGVDVAACLDRELPNTRVVIVTVYDTPKLRKLCHDRGASGFIPKHALCEELPVVLGGLFGNDNT